LADLADVIEEGVSDVNVILWPFNSLIYKLLERDIPPPKEAAELTSTKAKLYLKIWIKFGV